MERYTYFEDGKWRIRIGDTDHSGPWIDRLAPYEDTGLEPEEIKDILERYRGFRSAISDETGQPMVSWTRASELVRADKEGRVVVLPCKVGDTVFMCTQVFNGKDTVPMVGSRKIDRIEGNALNPIWVTSTEPFEMRFHPSEFGKTVFLTRAEAEAAIGGGGDG